MDYSSYALGVLSLLAVNIVAGVVTALRKVKKTRRIYKEDFFEAVEETSRSIDRVNASLTRDAKQKRKMQDDIDFIKIQLKKS